MATIGVNLILSSGATLTLELYNAGTILNTGGDALVEVGTSGYFEADVAEAIVANLDAVIKESGVAIAGGTLYLGQSQVGRLAIPPTTLANAEAVWDEVIAGHLTAGSTGAALNAAGGSGDLWATALPAAYASGTAGAIVAAILADTGTTLPATLTEIKGSTFVEATDALDAVRAAVDAGGVVNVLPAVGIVADRSPGATISPVVGETISQSITLYQTDGTTPVDLSGKTLAIVFETMAGVDVAVVASGNIAISGDDDNTVTFAYPSAVTASERTLRFAIKDAAAPLTEYLKGLCNVTSGPRVDA